MILIYSVEIVILDLAVRLFLFLHILLLCLSKFNYRLILYGYLTKVSVISTFYDIVIHQFQDSREVLRLPVHAHDVVVFEICLDLLLPKALCYN